MEMESMEEGYLAKILIQEGTEGIVVGKVRVPRASACALSPPRQPHGLLRSQDFTGSGGGLLPPIP